MKKEFYLRSLIAFLFLLGASLAWGESKTINPITAMSCRIVPDNETYKYNSDTQKLATVVATTQESGYLNSGFMMFEKWDLTGVDVYRIKSIELTYYTKQATSAYVWAYDSSFPETTVTAPTLAGETNTLMGAYPKASGASSTIEGNSLNSTTNRTGASDPYKTVITIKGAKLTDFKNKVANNTIVFVVSGTSTNSKTEFYTYSDETYKPKMVIEYYPVTVTIGETTINYAEINSTLNTSLTANATVKIYDDVNMSNRIEVAAGLTVDVVPQKAGITITNTNTGNLSFLANKKDGTLNIGSDTYAMTVKYSSSTITNAVVESSYNTTDGYSTVNINNVTFDGISTNKQGLIFTNNSRGKVSLKNVTFSECASTHETIKGIVYCNGHDDAVTLEGNNQFVNCAATSYDIYATKRFKVHATNGITNTTPIKVYTTLTRGNVLATTVHTNEISKFAIQNEGYGLARKVSNNARDDMYAAYTVVVGNSIENGMVKVDKNAAISDEAVTVTATPDAGYQLATLQYNDGSDHDISTESTPYTFSMPAANVTVTATFTANTNTAYKVKHFKQNIDGTYPTDPTETDDLEGTTGNQTVAVAKSYEGFTAPSITQETIAGDGSTVVTLNYTRNSYTITFDSDGGTAVDAMTKKYGEELTEPTEPTKENYVFVGWYKGENAFEGGTMPAENFTLTAHWTAATVENVDDADNTNTAKESFSIQDSENATLTNITMNDATSLQIPASVNGILVTTIANGVFTAENTANVQSIDLSNTQVDLDMARDDASSPVKDVPANTLVYLPSGCSMTGNNVVIKTGTDTYSCTNFVMEGGNSTGKSYNVPKAFTATNVSLNREFDENVAATVCLPYALTQDQANGLGKFYYFSSVTGNTVNMTQVTTGGLESNKPYMFLPNSTTGSADAVTATNVTVSIANSQTSSETGGSAFTFQGVIADKTFTTDEIAGGIYGFAAEADHGASSVGQFVKCSNGAYVKSFRAYLICATNLTGEQHPAGARGLGESEALPDVLYVTLINGDGSTTSIGKLELIEIDDNTPRYNLSGQRVGKDYKGIVIINGKKVFIK